VGNLARAFNNMARVEEVESCNQYLSDQEYKPGLRWCNVGAMPTSCHWQVGLANACRCVLQMYTWLLRVLMPGDLKRTGH